MICTRCAHAADNQLAAAQHCGGGGGPGSRCDCQHRTDRYGPIPRALTLTVYPVASGELVVRGGKSARRKR